MVVARRGSLQGWWLGAVVGMVGKGSDGRAP